MQKLPHAKAHANSSSPTCPYMVHEKKNGVVLANLNIGGKLSQLECKMQEISKISNQTLEWQKLEKFWKNLHILI
jgi:hypothetical protein